MPLINSKYKASGLFKNPHFATIYSAKLRVAPKILQQRERMILSDGDFMDLDFSFSLKKTRKIAILLHGLEGNAQRIYIKGQAKVLIENGWDVCAVNYRGCSGEANKKYSSYNAGKTDDLIEVIQFLLEKNSYEHIALVGFSLGGNLLLKYLGEGNNIPKEIIAGVAISSPLHLRGSLAELLKNKNWVYTTSFLLDLRSKLKEKALLFPDEISKKTIKSIKDLKTFDDAYTAPAHGFKDAYDYYAHNSSLQFLSDIKAPVFILNAKNDSFLSPHCYPFSIAESSKNLYLEAPNYGGHVGFHITNKIYYSEQRVLDFLNTKIID